MGNGRANDVMTQEEADNLSIGDLITILRRPRSWDDRCNQVTHYAILMSVKPMSKIGRSTSGGKLSIYDVWDGQKFTTITCDQIVNVMNMCKSDHCGV